MKYFLNEAERKRSGSSCYHEFFKGKWDQKSMTFWNDDSLNISDDLMISLGLDCLIKRVASDYDPCGETEINEKQWRKIYSEAKKTGDPALQALEELAPWAEENFAQNKVFTILGL